MLCLCCCCAFSLLDKQNKDSSSTLLRFQNILIFKSLNFHAVSQRRQSIGRDLQLIRILYENIHSSYSLPTLNLPNYVRFRFDQLKEITGSGKTDSSTCSSAQCYIFCSSLWFIKTLRVDEREADVCSLKTSRCSILRISGY